MMTTAEDVYKRQLQGHTSQDNWTPDTAVSLWVAISDPAEEWPQWKQPTGAHDAYPKGAKVTHNGKRYTSNVDANTWEPPTQWTESVSYTHLDVYKRQGQVPPENITKGLLDVYRLEMMTGSTDHMFDIFAAQIATSPSAQKAVQEAVKAGGEIPQELAESLEDNYGLVYNAQTGMFDQIKKPVPTKIQEIQNIMRESGLNISDLSLIHI